MDLGVMNIVVTEDDSVDKKLKQVEKKLQNKYKKKRNINENFLKKSSNVWQKILSVLLNFICVVACLFCGFLCFVNIYSRNNNLSPTIAGYCSFKIVSESMEPNFHIGDEIVVKMVDAKTLKTGDIIVFYVNDDYRGKSIDDNYLINNDNISDLKYQSDIKSLFGIRGKGITNISNNSSPIFHTIFSVYEIDGERWFETKGTNNHEKDNWIIKQDQIVGVLVQGETATNMKNILSILGTNRQVIACILVPFVIVATVLVYNLLKDIQIAKLQKDIVEEKRKLTDPICVKNKVGFEMDKRTKYKVLATAPIDRIEEYIALLWKDGKAPNSVKKYYLKKRLLLRPLQELRDVNRECEEMRKKNVSDLKIAKYYTTRKQQIFEKQRIREQKLKAIKDNFKK